jgi:uncharacterized radical SAM superfamily Fe-S cluster-containing enzyme
VQKKIKNTRARCPHCKQQCPGEIVEREGKVFISRTCIEHGVVENLLSSDSAFYWLSKGAEAASEAECCGPGQACRASDEVIVGGLGRNAQLKSRNFQNLSTCLALIEIVDSCNLACPTCFADSPVGVGENLKYYSLENIKERVEGVIAKKGKIEILQLSGGEPTFHPELPELLNWCFQHPSIDYVLLNTNGIKLVKDTEFFKRFVDVVKPVLKDAGQFQLYLQWDGLDAKANKDLRGADLSAIKQKVIESCEQEKIPITLAMTVIPENLNVLWESVQFGLKYTNIRGIAFQPRFGSGRMDDSSSNRLSVADIVNGLLGQSEGVIKSSDFTPLPCGDPNCATIGYLLRINGELRSISEFVDFAKLQGFLSDRIRYRPEDLERCGCESEPLAELLKKYELQSEHSFRLFIKPFMDAWSWDEDRIDRCCTHVIRPDGKLDSFCRYYSGFSDYRQAP